MKFLDLKDIAEQFMELQSCRKMSARPRLPPWVNYPRRIACAMAISILATSCSLPMDR